MNAAFKSLLVSSDSLQNTLLIWAHNFNDIRENDYQNHKNDKCNKI